MNSSSPKRFCNCMAACLFLTALGMAASAGAQSPRAGLGSVPYPGGVTFRVWAPTAAAAAVAASERPRPPLAAAMFCCCC